MNDGIDALKELYVVIGNTIDYVEELEKIKSSIDTSPYVIGCMDICGKPQYQSVCDLYVPTIKYTQNKCTMCNSNHMKKIENTDRFDRYVMCDCFNDTETWNVSKLSVFQVIDNDRPFYYGFMDNDFVIFNGDNVFDSVDDLTCDTAYDRIAFTSEKACEEYCNIRNGRV